MRPLPSYIALLSLIMIAVFPCEAPATEFSVVVSAAKGPAISKLAQGTAWLPVKSGQKLAEDSLLQLLPGGAVKLNYRGSLAGKSKDFQLTLTEPIVVRITPQMLRRVDLSEVYLKKLAKESEEKKEAELLPLQAAWKRLSAIFDRAVTKIASVFGLGDGFEAGESLAQKVKKIKFITPIDNQNILVDDLPNQITVAWHPAEKKDVGETRYEVFLWPYNQEKPQTGLMTKETQYTLPVRNIGRYFLKVQTVDETHQSRAQLVNIISSLDLAASKDSKGSGAGKSSLNAQRTINLDYPGENSQILASRSRTEVSFSWRTVLRAKNYRLHIEGEENRDIPTGNEAYFSMQLARGSYRWWVSMSRENGQKIQSEVRSFKIEKRPASLASLMARLPLSGRNVVIWTESP